MTNFDEVWKPVVGFESAYEVSNHGRVRSLDRTVVDKNGVHISWKGRILKPRIDKSIGYEVVNVRWAGVIKLRRVYRLVAEAFLGPPPQPDYEVCHADGDKLNNHVSNLRWDTHKANMRDMITKDGHYNARKTHCKQGHEFTPENTRATRNGTARDCKTCARNSSRKHKLKKRQKSGGP